MSRANCAAVIPRAPMASARCSPGWMAVRGMIHLNRDSTQHSLSEPLADLGMGTRSDCPCQGVCGRHSAARRQVGAGLRPSAVTTVIVGVVSLLSLVAEEGRRPGTVRVTPRSLLNPQPEPKNIDAF